MRDPECVNYTYVAFFSVIHNELIGIICIYTDWRQSDEHKVKGEPSQVYVRIHNKVSYCFVHIRGFIGLFTARTYEHPSSDVKRG